jgi:hypothetical protein
MDRRSFLTAFFGGLGAVAVGATLTPGSAKAASVFDELQAMETGGLDPADLPAEDAIETQNRGGRGGGGRAGGGRTGGGRIGGGGGRVVGGGRSVRGVRPIGGGFRPTPGWGRPVSRVRRGDWYARPVRVYRRPVRRCWWAYDRWGRLVRRCAFI